MIKPEVVNQLNAIHELQLLMYLETIDEWKHTSSSRKILSESLSIAEVTLKVALKKLKNKGYVERVSKGLYKINRTCLQS